MLLLRKKEKKKKTKRGKHGPNTWLENTLSILVLVPRLANPARKREHGAPPASYVRVGLAAVLIIAECHAQESQHLSGLLMRFDGARRERRRETL